MAVQVCSTLPLPAPREAPDPERAVVWQRFCDAAAGFSPLPVSVAVLDGGPSAVLDAGVWARRVRPDRRAPSGTGVLGALLCVQRRIPTLRGLEVSATPQVAELLAAAAAAPPDCDPRERHLIAGLELTGAQMLRVAEMRMSVRVVDEVPEPRVPFRDRLRFGAGAEAAYHTFCAGHGHDLVSCDGSARPGDGTYGWAWFARWDRWRADAERFSSAGGNDHGRGSRFAEFRAACEALEAHTSRMVALTYDNNHVPLVATGALAPTCELSERLVDLCAAREAQGMPVVWFPLSASSASQRQQIVDALCARAEHALVEGYTGPWSAEVPLPELGFRRGNWVSHRD